MYFWMEMDILPSCFFHFWWYMPWVQVGGGFPHLHALLSSYNWFHRYTSGATPVNLLVGYCAVSNLGGTRDARPPLGQNFFISMQFLGTIDQIIGWWLPPPPSRPRVGISCGKSWIHHCSARGFWLIVIHSYILFPFWSIKSKQPHWWFSLRFKLISHIRNFQCNFTMHGPANNKVSLLCCCSACWLPLYFKPIILHSVGDASTNFGCRSPSLDNYKF